MRPTAIGLMAIAVLGLSTSNVRAQIEPVVDEVCGLLGCTQMCEADLQTCQSDLTCCQANLATCNENEQACNSDLQDCNDDLETCTTALASCSKFLATGQTTKYVARDDGDLKKGAALSYTDNGDGTITDNNTKLVWEKKIKLDGTAVAADLHDADNCYRWRGVCSVGGTGCGTDADCASGTCDAADCQVASPDGLTIFEWVAALNAANFAQQSDWRVPNRRELESLVDLERVGPSIDPAFNGASCGGGCSDIADPACSCTVSADYWSSSTYRDGPNGAWRVGFDFGNVNASAKANRTLFVRAVRGGSP